MASFPTDEQSKVTRFAPGVVRIPRIAQPTVTGKQFDRQPERTVVRPASHQLSSELQTVHI